MVSYLYFSIACSRSICFLTTAFFKYRQYAALKLIFNAKFNSTGKVFGILIFCKVPVNFISDHVRDTSYIEAYHRYATAHAFHNGGRLVVGQGEVLRKRLLRYKQE